MVIVLGIPEQEDFHRPEMPLEKTQEIDNEARMSKKAEMKRKFNRNQKRTTPWDIQLSSLTCLIKAPIFCLLLGIFNQFEFKERRKTIRKYTYGRIRNIKIDFKGTSMPRYFTYIIYYCNLWEVSSMPDGLIVVRVKFKCIIQNIKYNSVCPLGKITSQGHPKHVSKRHAMDFPIWSCM